MIPNNKLRQILTDFLGLLPPDARIEWLPGGASTAINAKATVNGVCYIIRLFDPMINEQKRITEIKAQQLAAEHGIAPMVHYYAPDHSSMVMECIEGTTLKLAQAEEPATIKALAKTVRILHSIPAEFLPRHNIVGTIEQQYKTVKKFLEPKPLPLLDQSIATVRLLEKVTERSKKYAFCHGDLNPTNMFYSPSPEYQEAHFVDGWQANHAVALGEGGCCSAVVKTMADRIGGTCPAKPRRRRISRDTTVSCCALHTKNKIILIDWADAMRTEPFFDLAIAALLSGMNKEQTELLLSSYLEQLPTEKQQHEFYFMQQAVRLGFALNMLLSLHAANALHVLELPPSQEPLYMLLRKEEELYSDRLREVPPEFTYAMATSALNELINAK